MLLNRKIGDQKMRLILSIVMLALVTTGCATTSQTQQAVNPKCDQLATYARGIAVMKESGVTMADIDLYTAKPVAIAFPLQRIKVDVFFNEYADPAAAYTHFYSACNTAGYDQILSTLRQNGRKTNGFMLQLSTELPEPTLSH